MARIALTCTCGWNFFIPGSTPGWEIACPSCTRPVNIPGRKPGMDAPLSPGAIAARLQRRAALGRLLTMILGLGIAAGAAALTLRRKAEAPPEAPAPLKADARPRRLPETPATAAPRPSASPTDKAQLLRRRVLENVWLVNMASIVSECLRLRNLAREWQQLQSTVVSYESKIRADQEELAATKGSVVLDPYFAEGDRIVAFGDRDFSLLRRGDAAQVLHAWMNAWRAGVATEQVQVLREDRPLTIILHFPEDTREILLLLRHPHLQLAPLPDHEPAMAAPGTSPPEQTVDLIANDVLYHSEVFGTVIAEMRRRTEPLTTSKVPIWPDESARGIVLIANPLTFQPSELAAAVRQELDTWWNGLTREERRRFASYFGLWCAYTRGQSLKK